VSSLRGATVARIGVNAVLGLVGVALDLEEDESGALVGGGLTAMPRLVRRGQLGHERIAGEAPLQHVDHGGPELRVAACSVPRDWISTCSLARSLSRRWRRHGRRCATRRSEVLVLDELRAGAHADHEADDDEGHPTPDRCLAIGARSSCRRVRRGCEFSTGAPLSNPQPPSQTKPPISKTSARR